MTGCWSHWLWLEHGGGWLVNKGENLVNTFKSCSFSLLIHVFLPSLPININHNYCFVFFSPVPNMCPYASPIVLFLSAESLLHLTWLSCPSNIFRLPAVFRPSESFPTTAAWTTWTASAAPAPLCLAGMTTTSVRPAAPWADGAASDRSAPATQALFKWSTFQSNSLFHSVSLGLGGRMANNRDILWVCSFFFLRHLYHFDLNSCRCHASLIH